MVFKGVLELKIISYLKLLRCKLIIKKSKCNITLGQNSTFGRGTILYCPDEMNIGSNVYIGKYCSLETNVDINNNVLIGNNVGLIGRYDHDYSQIGVSIKDSHWIGDKEYNFKGKGLKITIDEDVWIGYGTVILSGVNIGRGSIVAAGSVVTKDIPPYSICAGNPCRILKQRFSEQEIIEHEKILYK